MADAMNDHWATAGQAPTLPMRETVRLIAVASLNDVAKVEPASDLVEDLGFDELNRVDLAVSLEEEFGIEISDDQAEAWVTAGDVVTFVRECMVRRGAL
jgi:acyl carrier protein